MPRLLYKLPYFDCATQVTVAGETVAVKPDQIILWASISERSQLSPPSSAPRIPVILDTGLSHNFAIREEHLTGWAGLYPPVLPILGHVRLSGSPANLLDADVWVYRNKPGHRDPLPDAAPIRLEMEAGIAVFPEGAPAVARLPLLGLRGLRWAKLQLAIDCWRLRVHLRTPRRLLVVCVIATTFCRAETCHSW